MKIFVLGIRGFPNVQGGAEKHCEELYPRLVELGCEVIVPTRTPYIPKEKRISEWKGVKFVHLWALRRKNFEAIIHSFLSSIKCILKRPEIAHFHNVGPAIFIPLVKLTGIRTVLTYHSVNYKHQKWGRFAKIILRMGEFLGMIFSDKIIVVSQVTKKFLEKKYCRGLNYIPNGVNLPEIISAGEMLRKHKIEPRKYVFTASRFVPEKGLHDLIEAYRILENPDFKIVIAGDADHETDYSRRIKKMAKETEGVVLTGFISGKPLQELYSNAGLFVLPSYYEGLPIALLEALSYGLPVLVSDIPQNREIPLPYFRYFQPGDIEKLSKKLIELFNLGITEEEQNRVRKIIEEKYNWDIIAKKTYEIYRSILL